MASPAASLREIVRALLGISTYSKGEGYGAKLDDHTVESIREAMGGNLATMPTSKTRWYLADLEAAIIAADRGDLQQVGQLRAAMMRDGTISGVLGTLTDGIVRLPKRFYGDKRAIADLKSRNGTRSVFDDMFPPSELGLLFGDGKVCGAGVAELCPVEGRDFPVMVRLDPQFLRYRWSENRWYFLSIAGPLPITPGDGRWILHTPGGRIAPWRAGLYPALGRAYINKEHALLHRSNFGAKLANPARVATTPAGATELQRKGLLSRLMAWGVNTVFELPPGYDAKLLESNGRGYDVFQADIDTSDRESAIAIAGQVVTTDGGAGFSNSDIHRAIRADIIQATADEGAHTLNTQALPAFVALRYGVEALRESVSVEWDVKRPTDLTAEAQSMSTAAGAIKALGEALAPFGKRIDATELCTRFGIPIDGDKDGDGETDEDEHGDLDDPRPDAAGVLQ